MAEGKMKEGKTGGHEVSDHRVPQVAASGPAPRTWVRKSGRSPQDVVPGDRLRGLGRDLQRLGLFVSKRLLALLVTVLTGVYLTILIANMGGQVDELRLVQIKTAAAEQVRSDPAFHDLPAAEREALMQAQVQLEVERLRLDEPFIWRSFDYLYRAMLLDLGRAEEMHSDAGSRRVYNIIVERLPATLLLFGTANLLVFGVSVYAALKLSRRYGSALDRTVIGLAPTSAAPAWFYGIFLILLLAFIVPLFPTGGMVAVPPPEDPWAYAASVIKHLALPVTAMFVAQIFISIYSWRTFFLIHASEDYVEMARAKGLPDRLIEQRYILRPTLSPIVTSFLLMLIGLWGGAIILEQVFNWPGLGTLLFEAIGHRDTPVIIGSVVIFAYLLAATVFLLDFIYAILDPRVRIAGAN